MSIVSYRVPLKWYKRLQVTLIFFFFREKKATGYPLRALPGMSTVRLQGTLLIYRLPGTPLVIRFNL